MNAESACVCVHVACTHTGLHVCVYTYIYARTLVYMCMYILTYMYAQFRGVCVSIGMYVGWIYMSVRVYLHARTPSLRVCR